VFSACEWFTNHTFIRGPPSLPPALWTYPKQWLWEAALPRLGAQHSCGDDTSHLSLKLQWKEEELSSNRIPERIDYFARHPWRAPGSAPLHSSCGVAGGNPLGCPPEAGPGEGGQCPGGGYGYGPRAEDFPFRDIVTSNWTIGSVVEVGWGITANHGGGYSYRLCKLGKGGRPNLTEECFQATPLDFVGSDQWVQYGEDKANRTTIKAFRTRKGTHPPGSQWTRNPIPACAGAYGGFLDTDYLCREGTQFPAPAPGLLGFGVRPGAAPQFLFSIVDQVQVPTNLEPGEYVLSFRWDCEQTAQVWSACASIHLVQGP